MRVVRLSSLKDSKVLLTLWQVNTVLPGFGLGHAFCKHLAEPPRSSGSFGRTTYEPSRELLIFASSD